MRMRLAGYSGPRPPLVLTLTNGVAFVKASHVSLGYKNYDVICIGGSGGKGGDAAFDNPGGNGYTLIRGKGGAGGGGGLHRKLGLLSSLPASCPVIVGTAGADQTVQPGPNGGASTFNGTTCRASGGIGGGVSYIPNDAVQVVDPNSPPFGGIGGAGGAGNSETAGGGGAGSTTIWVPNSTTGGTGAPPGGNYVNNPGSEGSWDGVVGKGGGGGNGGARSEDAGGPLPTQVASAGGRGSYSVGDTSVFGPGGSALFDGTHLILPGRGGGAKALPLNLQAVVYGSKVDGASGNGLVIIRLT